MLKNITQFAKFRVIIFTLNTVYLCLFFKTNKTFEISLKTNFHPPHLASEILRIIHF